jgi:hypothetical protein
LRITATPALPAPFRFEGFPLTSTISSIAKTSNQRAQCSDHCRADGYIALRAAPDSVVAASGDCRNRLITKPCKTGRPVRLNRCRSRSFTGNEVFFPQTCICTEAGKQSWML